MRTFAILPAAGRSQRMGQPKLLLPWRGGTVIEHVLCVWRDSGVEQVVMVVHPLDDRLAELGAAGGAHVVRPETPPPDMKASVRLGLQWVATAGPLPCDAWLLAPADMPGLTATAIASLVAAYGASVSNGESSAPIWVPSYRGRRGHPVLFGWSMAAEVAHLAEGEGLNALLARHVVREVEMADPSICEDLDTPADYDRLRANYES